MVHVRKLLFKKYIKNHQIKFFFKQNRGEENNIRKTYTSTRLKKKNFGVCITFIVFMINLTNFEINYQYLSLSLSWTC